MPLPGFALVTPLIFAQSEKGGFKHMSLPGFPSVTPFILSEGEKGGCFDICFYLALPLSLHSSYGKVKRGGGVNICLYLAFPLSLHSFYRKVKKSGVGSTYVTTWLCLSHSSSAWLCLCHSSHGKVRRGGF